MPNQKKVQPFDSLNWTIPLQGRLTLTSGTPVTTSDVTGAGTLYYTPYLGYLVAIYDNTNWSLYEFSQISLSLTLTGGKNYDVFLYNNSGTLTMELSAAWTNDTTRADAVSYQNGIVVKTSDKTRVLLGTIRASGGNVTEDSLLHRFVANMPYTYVERKLFTCPGYIDDGLGGTYTTSSTTWVEANGGTGSKVDYVCTGFGNTIIKSVGQAGASNASGLGSYFGLGHDTSAGPTNETTVSSTTGTGVSVTDNIIESAGYHYLDLLIRAQGGTSTFYVDDIRQGAPHDPHVTFIDATMWG